MRIPISVVGVVAVGATLAGTAVALAGTVTPAQSARIKDAAAVLTEIRSVPDKDIPQQLWDKASCVLVVPALKKAAFIIGGEYGKGLMSCRNHGSWSAPIFMDIQKGSWGFQAGAESVDLVLLVMNPGDVEKMLSNTVSLGIDASVAAGPVGRNAQAATDAQLKAEVLAYSRAQGLFAGLDISGGVVKPNVEDNSALYGKDISPHAVVTGRTAHAPAETRPFLDALGAHTK